MSNLDRRTLPMSQRPLICRARPLGQYVHEPLEIDILPAQKPKKAKKPAETQETQETQEIEIIEVDV